VELKPKTKRFVHGKTPRTGEKKKRQYLLGHWGGRDSTTVAVRRERVAEVVGGFQKKKKQTKTNKQKKQSKPQTTDKGTSDGFL